MLEGAALKPGEHRLVDGRGVLGAAQDGAAPRPAQRLVGREGHHVGHADRVRMDPAGDQPGDVGGVEEQQGADLVGDAAEDLRIDDPGVGRGSGDDHLRPVLLGEGGQLVVVDALVALGHAVGDEVVAAGR